jgi:hypothetical membrane protein
MTSRRWGGALWVGCLQFFVAEAVAAAGFVGSYSFRRNYISDFGAFSCAGGGCSPLHALGLIAASGLGVALVGLAAEDSAPGWHYLGAAENLLFCNAGAALLGLSLFREGSASRAVGLLSLSFGLIGLAGLGGLAAGHDFGLGVGGVERVAAYPFPLWIAGLGAWLIGTAEKSGVIEAIWVKPAASLRAKRSNPGERRAP